MIDDIGHISTISEPERLTYLLHSLIERNMRELGYNKKYPVNQSSISEIEKLHRIDGVSYEKIEEVIRWSQDDSFWKQNILSGSKLRKQFPRLLFKMAEENDRGPNIDTSGVRFV